MALFLRKNRQRKLLYSQIEVTNPLTRFMGIMFRSAFYRPLLFTGSGRIAIHSFFCFSDFDAVFLDKHKRIVKLLTVKPWTPLVSAGAVYLFEFPPGTIKKFRLKKGDVLKWS